MIAENLQNLWELQKECNVPFLYEASSCASIPIIRNIEEYYDNDLLSGVEGIFNGSSNYILTKVCRDGQEYGAALKKAQELGFAESNPILDVGGFDAKYKLTILTAHAFGAFLNPDMIFNYGIQNLSAHDQKFLSEKGWKIKPMSTAKRIGNKLCVWGMPQMMSPKHKLYSVEEEYNAVIVEAAFSDQQFFVGKGAGSYPTGSAVLSDISALTYDYRYEYKKKFQITDLEYTTDFLIELYVRYYNENDIKDLKFHAIEESYRGRDYNYIIGKVVLSDLIRCPILKNEHVFISQTINETIEVI